MKKDPNFNERGKIVIIFTVYWTLSFLRFAYLVWILNNLLDETDDESIDVYVHCDIACFQETRLEVF